MKIKCIALFVILVVASGAVLTATAQQRQDPAMLISSQIEALNRLSLMDGVWRGPATSVLPGGEKHTITQTERVGPFLGGSVRVIEGRGYEVDGSVSFNALGIISFDPESQSYSMRSYAQGHAGDFPLTPTADGFSWEISMGSAMIRYVAVIKDGTWHEVGDRIVPGEDPMRFFEMTLRRLGDSDWPAGGAIRP